MSETVILAIISLVGQTVLAVIGLYGLVLSGKLGKSQSDLHHQLNSLTDARVEVAGQAGHAEGFIAGGAAERDQLAKVIAAQVAVEVAQRLADQNKPAIQVKPVVEVK